MLFRGTFAFSVEVAEIVDADMVDAEAVDGLFEPCVDEFGIIGTDDEFGLSISLMEICTPRSADIVEATSFNVVVDGVALEVDGLGSGVG